MLKKQLIGNFYLFVVLISFLSCKHEELIKNDQRSSTNFNPPIPIIAPTLYYTEELSWWIFGGRIWETTGSYS